MSQLRLGIISDCIHFQHPDGRFGTETHILLQQLEALAFYFEHITLCCPVVAYDEKKVATYYSIKNISIISLPNVGGNNLQSKIQLIKTIPVWWKAFKKTNAVTDIVYQRFPNNLNIPGFLYFWLKRKNTFATFTGTWKHYNGEPFTYQLQRWLLKKFFKGPVWAYMDAPSTNARIHKGFSPSYSEKIWEDETEQVNQRIQKLYTDNLSSLKMITVGAFVPNKNQQFILEVCLLLQQKNIPFQLTMVGDGVLKAVYQNFINQHQLNNNITIAGKKTATQLRQLYREHDFIIQAPIHEGFGKVPIEGFFHGLVPIISNVGLAEMIIDKGNRGFSFNIDDAIGCANILQNLLQNQAALANIITNGRQYSATQTLEAWAKEYYKTIAEFYHL